MLVRRINVSQVRRAAWRRKTYCGGGEVLRWPREGHACRGTAPRPHGEARHATQGGRRGFLKQLMMIAFLLGFCGIDLFEDGPWAVGAHRGMRRREGARRGDGLLAAALGRVRGACEHGGVRAQSKAGRVGPVRQRRKGKGGRGAALSVEERR